MFYFAIVLAFLLFAISFFDEGLFFSFLLLLLLSSATVFVISKTSIKSKAIYTVFFIALVIHIGFVLFIYYTGFKPFGGGGDFSLYNQIAIEIAHRFSHGNFSLQGLYTEHFFPILIGMLYMVTFPSMIVGQFFTVWLAAVSILLVYLVVLEIGGTKKIAFLTGFIVTFYPSYLYFGSVLLKDTLIIPLVLAGMLLILKMLKNFSWVTFLLFFIILTGLINLRFYIGYALMFAFIFSWPLASLFGIKKRMVYWLLVIFFLGFSSQVLGDGYYGFNNFKKFLNPKQITYFREVVYANPPSTLTVPTTVSIVKPSIPQPSVPLPSAPTPKPSVPLPPIPPPESNNGNGSTFTLETGFGGGITTFLKNYSQSFMYSLLGPFPWQFRNQRQVVGLAETIPWYMLILISIYGSVRFIRRKGMPTFLTWHKFTFPVLIFSVLALGALSLFINNYGIIARIRIPMFICFICVMCMSFNDGDIEKLHEKISHYWRRGIYRLSFFTSAFKTGK